VKIKPIVAIAACATAALVVGLIYYKKATPQETSPGDIPLTSGAGKAPVSSGGNLLKPQANVGLRPATSSDPNASGNPILAIVDENQAFETRLNSARTAVTNLAPAEVEALRAFLLKRSPLDETQEGHVLKNALLDSVCELRSPPSELVDAIIQVYHDQSQDEVIRDYAVQHMAALHEQIDDNSSSENNNRQGELAKLRSVLWEAVGETDGSIAGTAILGLSHLSERSGDFNTDKIAETALRLATKEGVSELTRITALQVCASLGAAQALPVVTELAQRGETMPIRISAIGALGLLGEAGSKPFLNSLVESDEVRFREPALQALRRITQREKDALRKSTKS